MDIRKALLTKLHNSSPDELKEIINGGIASKEETILPGLGVLFEEYYNSLNNTQKDEMINSLNGKSVALFGSYGWGSGEWMTTWEEQVKEAGADLFENGLIINETPDEDGLNTCEDFGKRFAVSK